MTVLIVLIPDHCLSICFEFYNIYSVVGDFESVDTHSVFIEKWFYWLPAQVPHAILVFT